MPYLNPWRWSLVTAVGCLIIPALAAQSQPSGNLKVGIYDSRAIAVAYARSEMHRQWLAQLMSERDQARSAGDTKRIKEIEAQGAAMQERFHQQGFGTASVTGLLDKIKYQIPGVAQETGVALIVSKWEVVYRDPAVEYLDVTIPLVRRFGADTKVIQMIEDLLKHPPVPADQLHSESGAIH